MKFVRSAIVLLAALLLLALMSGTALAVAPGNDTFPGATPVVIGFSEVLDTTEATTDSDDAQLNTSGCYFPSTDASVWYAFTASSDTPVLVDVSQSSYTAGVLVGTTSSLGSLQPVACGWGRVILYPQAGTTYYVLVVDVQPGGSGGQLSISFDVPTPPTLDFTVNPVGQVNARTGIATISGNYTCSNADYVVVYVSATQNVGRFTISGFFYNYYSGSETCDGVSHDWSADVVSYNGKFAGGKMLTTINAYACNFFSCAGVGPVVQTVQLRGGPKVAGTVTSAEADSTAASTFQLFLPAITNER